MTIQQSTTLLAPNLDNSHHYRTSFSKHLHSLARSGFFSRRIDADDRQFLEYVRKCGVANGSLPNSGAVLLEELEFWHFPYSVAPGIERRVGKRPREEESQEARSLRQARSRALHARRIIRENEKAIAEAELAREHREWEAAEQKRRVRELITDAEWEAAAPAHARFGTTIERHHVPQWKLDEGREELEREQELEQKRKHELQERELERRKQEQEQEQLEQEQELERRRQEQELDKQKQELEWRERERRKWEQEQTRQTLELEWLEQERKREQEQELERKQQREREEAIAQARQTLADANIAKLNLGPIAAHHYSPDTLKIAIVTLIKSVPNRHWMLEELTRALGCNDSALINRCVDEMIRDGKLWRHY
jgi:hypothetical protein